MKKKIVWQDKSKRTVLKSVIIGHFAMWIVRQSPYLSPNDLDKGIEEFDKAIGNTVCFDEISGEHLITTSYNKLKENIDSAISMSKTIVSWNIAKKGSGPVFVSRYDSPEPDYDFIDLDALARNIAQSVWLELCYDNGFFEQQEVEK